MHLLKLFIAPQSLAASHWRGEIVMFHNELLGRLTRSMHHRIEIPVLWDRALKEASAKLDGEREIGLQVLAKLRGCPLTIEDLAGEDFDTEAALNALHNKT